MITEQDLNEAIAECQGVRHPNANTCIQLAAFYTIQDRMFSNKKESPSHRTNNVVGDKHIMYEYESDTDFGRLVQDKDMNAVIELMDETVSAIAVFNPPLYASILRRLEAL